MLKLIKNEYIKIFKKKSTIVLTILFVLATIALPTLVYLLSENTDSILYNVTSSVYDSEIEYHESVHESARVELLKFEKEQKIPIYEDGWKTKACEMAFSLGINPNEYIEKYNNAIAGNNDSTESTDEYDEYYDDGLDYYKGFSYPTISFLFESSERKEIKDKIISAVENNDPNVFFEIYTKELYPKYMEFVDVFPDECEKYEFDILYYSYSKLLDEDIDITKDEWAYDVASIYGNGKTDEEDASLSARGIYLNTNKEEYEIAKYRLENKISATIEKSPYGNSFTSDDDFYDLLISFPMLITLAGLVLFMIGIGIISKEYNQGTIKFLLINPVKRSSIFWSKVITLVSMLLIASIWVVISQLLLDMLLTMKAPAHVSFFYFKDGDIVAKNGLFLVLMLYVDAFINMLMLLFASIMLSALFKNGALSAGSLIIAYIINGIAGGYASSIGFNLFNISIFNNVDLYKISFDWTKYTGQTLGFAIAVYIIHMIIFLWTARDSFVKKDI